MAEAVATNEGEEAELGEAEGRGEGELDHHVAGEAACIRRPTRQKRLDAAASGRFHDDASSNH